MKITKFKKLDGGVIVFDNGSCLEDFHFQQCCEHHYMDVSDLTPEDFDGLEFDLNGDFFERIEGYGIALKPINGHPVRIPCYGSNNGYYSSNLILQLSNADGTFKQFDITECQEIDLR